VKGYLTCELCGISISWEHLEHNFMQVKTFHELKCGQPQPKTVDYAALIKGEK